MNYEELPEKKKKKSGFGKGFIAGLLVAVAVIFGLSAVRNVLQTGKVISTASKSSLLDSHTVQKINTLAEYIQQTYYEDVDVEELREGLYAGLFENLDVYSQYYTAEQYQSIYESSVSGTYCGIGASLQQDAKTKDVTIVHVYDGSPAQKAGLQEGDYIVSADEYEANSMELTEFVNHIRGEEGTKVHLVIYRESEGKELEYEIVREQLVLPTVSHEMMDEKTGYIDVTEFTDATPEQFSAALEDLKDQGMKALIVDLRSNPGGMLTAVCDMLDEILPEGLIVYTEDKKGEKKEYFSGDEKSLDLPLVVLVNGQSASASEIFAGAIQDRGAGTVIGTTTYGKGVVQTIRSLKDGSAFKVTTNRYFTPGGTCIQDIGIKPDVELEYEFLGKENETYSYDKDNQIQKALEIIKKEK
ncbi:MAG: S41 family peptidase [Eubacterium sp.]